MNNYSITIIKQVLKAYKKADNPFRKGRPNIEDDRMIQALVSNIHKQLSVENPKGMLLSDLAYQSKAHHAEMEQTSLKTAKTHLPMRTVDQDLCAQCQTCKQVCPTDAVSFAPYPDFGISCIFCFNCMKNCPEGAIKADLSGIWQRIRDRANYFNERPHTQIFF